MNPSLLSQVAATAPPRRPRLAIVVGSGGVRSMAALGMAQVLLQHGVRPDLVVGCSTGSIFGALIAAGHSADEAVRIATTLWSADVANQRRWRALPQMVWPRLGRFDADFAMRHDHRVMQRLRQALDVYKRQVSALAPSSLAIGWPSTAAPRVAFRPMARPSPMLPVHGPTSTTTGFKKGCPRGSTYSSHTRRTPVARNSETSSCRW